MPFWRLHLTKVSYHDQMHFSNESRGNSGSVGGATQDSTSARRQYFKFIKTLSLKKVGSNGGCPDKSAVINLYYTFGHDFF